jgi:AcrR family transcriptional regulator
MNDMSETLNPVFGGDYGSRTKRDAILEAAAAIFCQEGFAGASIDAVAARAGVSRQTVYNQIGDKEKLLKVVVAEITTRTSADFFRLLETFPDRPKDLEAELTAFSVRLLTKYSCDPNNRWLVRMLQNEGSRYPELFATWREYGPGRKYPAIAARLAQLAYGGYLTLEDPEIAARQFMALLTAELRQDVQFGIVPPKAEIEAMASRAVKTFLRAFASK